MSVYADQRRQIRDVLTEAGINAYATAPERVTPPCAFVGPGDPYITRDGAGMGAEIVRHAVTVVVAAGVNDQRADDLDEFIGTVLDALESLFDDGFDVGDVDQPGSVSINQQAHLGTVIAVSRETERPRN